ncbi:SDR family oxidoreductase [uncultured Nocardioides sp.]|uniref:SDR family oxidoreductase n=1 Tax=uncultured Nocardioides sp. TaxID=198441 RepID=UPI00263914B0|nr:SDR family oxidoreductase [uncultured Nocardioides sp.]
MPCAGVGPHVSDKTLIAKLNYFGATEMTGALRDLLGKRKGNICLISSVSAAMTEQTPLVEAMLSGDEAKAVDLCEAQDAQTIYASTKRAITVWMRRSVTDLAKQGIRINAVAPGIVQTPLSEKVLADAELGQAMRDFGDSVPLGCIGQPKQIADVVSFLLGPGADYMTGAIIFVDGGHDAMLRPDGF